MLRTRSWWCQSESGLKCSNNVNVAEGTSATKSVFARAGDQGRSLYRQIYRQMIEVGALMGLGAEVARFSVADESGDHALLPCRPSRRLGDRALMRRMR